MKKDFNEWRFTGLNHKDISNNYWTMNRVNKNEDKVIVKIGENHLVKTKFGYALILDKEHVVFVKNWQVSNSFYGIEVMLTKEFFQVKKWGDHKSFVGIIEANHNFDTWLASAKDQKDTEVKWSKVIEIG